MAGMLVVMSNHTNKSSQQALTVHQLQGLVEEQEASGLSMAAFARKVGIPAYRLYDARTRLRRSRRAASLHDLHPLHVIDPESAAGEAIELRLPSGLSIKVERNFDEVALRRLLKVLVSC
jgi:hypothetical protein